MAITIDISYGEFLDKLSILEIKRERIADTDKQANIDRELRQLSAAWERSGHGAADIACELGRLKAVNARLWDIEDAIREKERSHDFGLEFVELARAVYFNNDERAAIKRDINVKLGSALVEEKSYAEYR